MSVLCALPAVFDDSESVIAIQNAVLKAGETDVGQ